MTFGIVHLSRFTYQRSLFKISRYIGCHNLLIYKRSLTMGSIVSCRKNDGAIGSNTRPGSANEIMNDDSASGDSEIFEKIVCSEDDIPNEGAKAFNINGDSILIAKSEGEVYAVGSKCTHFGLSLEKGSVCKGRIRCPFHGACFSLKTGDIEDFPGLDSIPKFNAEIVDGKVKVSGKISNLAQKKRRKTFSKLDPRNDRCFVVVGGGAAGAKCVETLRQEGFTGEIKLVSAESCAPYDRTKLSKVMRSPPDAISLRGSEFHKSIDVELMLSTKVVKVDPEEKRVITDKGAKISFDKLFLATGGRPRNLSVPGADLQGIFVLRNPDDANAIAKSAVHQKVVVVGTSFIGMEVAAFLCSDNLSASVTVVGSSTVPFQKSLGSVVGERIQRLYQEKGVTFRNSAKITKIEGNGRVEKVILNDDVELEAGVVVLGIGVDPSTEYADDTSFKKDGNGHIEVNQELETSVKDIYCGGDIAAFPLFLNQDGLSSVGHWQMAHSHGHVAALNMLGQGRRIHSVPFFWTVLFGKSFRYTGYGSFDDVIISGDLEGLAFIAYYIKGGRVVGLASIGKDPAAAKYADALLHGRYLTKEEVETDGEAALKL